jgi:hypothetical protein
MLGAASGRAVQAYTQLVEGAHSLLTAQSANTITDGPALADGDACPPPLPSPPPLPAACWLGFPCRPCAHAAA